MLTLTNHGAYRYDGWIRRNIERDIGPALRWPDGTILVRGAEQAPGLWQCDALVRLEPGQTLKLNPTAAGPIDFRADPLPHPSWYGGPPAVNDTPLSLVGKSADGAACTVHARTRVGRMLVLNLWMRHYPGDPWAEAWWNLTASNPDVPDMGETTPELRLSFGDAIVHVLGAGFDAPIVEAGTRIADAAGRVGRVVFVWAHHTAGFEDWHDVISAASLGIGGCGIAEMWEGGNGRLDTRPHESLAQWHQAHWPRVVDGLHDWTQPPVGPNRDSRDSGRQEEQLWHPGAEAQTAAGTEIIRWLASIKTHAARPSNYLEADGSPLDLDRHPGLILYHGRPHRVGADMLGKPRELDKEEAHGFFGPDSQHLHCSSLMSSARILGDPLSLYQIDRIATVWLGMRTVDTGAATDNTSSAREVLYDAWFVAEYDRTGPDRVVAARLRDRLRQRMHIVRSQVARNGGYVYGHRDDRVGPGLWALASQESMAAYGLDLAGEMLGEPRFRETALEIAHWVKRRAYRDPVTVRREVPIDETQALPWVRADGRESGAWSSEWPAYGFPCCIAVFLRHDPADEWAIEAWDHLIQQGDTRWCPPGVR